MNSQLEVEKSELENKFTEALSVLQGKVKVLYLHYMEESYCQQHD